MLLIIRTNVEGIDVKQIASGIFEAVFVYAPHKVKP